MESGCSGSLSRRRWRGRRGRGMGILERKQWKGRKGKGEGGGDGG